MGGHMMLVVSSRLNTAFEFVSILGLGGPLTVMVVCFAGACIVDRLICLRCGSTAITSGGLLCMYIVLCQTMLHREDLKNPSNWM
ncbi:hypothetical protein V8C42DRAFT_319150 [Trichoderma barbatum]